MRSMVEGIAAREVLAEAPSVRAAPCHLPVPGRNRIGTCPSPRIPIKRAVIRKDPVKFRVAIPAADPPDNRMHGPIPAPAVRTRVAMREILVFHDCSILSNPMVHESG